MNKKLSTYNLVVSGILVTLITISLHACGSGDRDRDNGDNNGGSRPEASATIGPSGGTVEVADSSSPLYRVKVEIPEGALAQETTITISTVKDDSIPPEGFIKAGKGIELGPEGKIFQLPVRISIPYVEEGINEDTVNVYEYNEDSGYWYIKPILSIDTDQNIITIQTLTFSPFYLLAIKDGAAIPSQSYTPFDPDQDGLYTSNIFGNCYGEVSFVQWFWENKRLLQGSLGSWHRDEHFKIAEMSQCTTWREDIFDWLDFSRLNDSRIAENLMVNLYKFSKPQILVFGFKKNGVKERHAILVYNYETLPTLPETVRFYVYDPNSPDPFFIKKAIMTYDGMFLNYPYYPDIEGFQLVDSPYYTPTLEFVYEYIEDPPRITDVTPTAVIDNSRPTVSAVVHYPFINYPFINPDLIEMKVDGKKITPSFERIDSHNAKINFTPSYDLSMGQHTVYVSGKSYYSQAKPGEKECAPPVEKEWTFEIMKCANIAGSWNFSEEGSMTCTIDGETQTEIISGTVEVMIEQNDCNIRYEIPVPDELGDGYIERTGKIDGNNIDISGIYVIPLGEANITQNIATMHGTISGDEINLSGSGIARGTIDGMSFSCTGTSTAVATR